ncbi:MAG: outer-membrane lipoprotein carrier protein LolA [Tannerellaceae bacterium]|nr:outer-membrane lipoprotein carrier protein LolA [Tannerellaceae bacterium]
MRQKLNILKSLLTPPLGGWGVLFLLSFTLQSGESILDRAAETYRKAGGVSASFVMNNKSPQQGYAESFEGTILMKGEMFVLETPDMKSWFNGSTLWSYMEHTGEVNVTSPTGEDLRFTNPAILLMDYKKDFTATYKGEGTLNGKKTDKIELLPKTKGDVTKVELQLDKNTHLPVRVAVDMRNGSTGTITINEIKTNINYPDTRFTFNPAEYPDADIIDLR